MAAFLRWLPADATWPARGWRGSAGWLCVLAASACTAFESGTDELEQGFTSQSLEPGRDWSCLPASLQSTPSTLLESAAGALRVVESVQMLNVVDNRPLQGLFVRACAQRDVNCLEPLTELAPVGADGWVDLPLYEGYAGYLEITGEAIVPTVLFYPDPIVEGRDRYTTPIGLIERRALPVLTGAVGMQQAPGRGLIVMRTLDCQNTDALGVSYTIDRIGSPFYFVGGLPSTSVTETRDSSLGGFTNVDTGVALIGATLTPEMRPVVPTTSVLIRPDWLTAVRFVARRSVD